MSENIAITATSQFHDRATQVIGEISQKVKEKALRPKSETQNPDYIKELPQAKKQDIENFRHQSEKITDNIYSQTDSISTSINSDEGRLNFLQAKELKNQDDQSEIDRLSQNILKNSQCVDSILISVKSSQELIKGLFETITSESLNNYVDHKTGLYLESFIVGKLSEYLQKGQTDYDVKMIVSDFMLFHTTNHNLGSSETDKRLFSCAQAQIAASRYLSNDVDFYPAFSTEEQQSNKHLNKYFPPGSPIREKLDYLQSQKVQLIPGRAKAGGDEANQIILIPSNLSDGHKKIIENTAIKIIDHTIHSTSTTRGFDFIDTTQKTRELTTQEIDQRNIFYQHFCDSISKYKIKPKSNGPDVFGQPRRDLPFTEEEITHNAFCDALRAHYKISQEPEILKPEYNLSFEYTKSSLTNGEMPSFEDAFLLFMNGRDTYGNSYQNREGLLNTDGSTNNERLEICSEEIYQQIEKQINGRILSTEEFDALAEKQFYGLVVKNLFDTMNDEVDLSIKNSYKREITLNAFTDQDTKAIIICGASSESGRLLYDPKSDQNSLNLINETRQYFEELFKSDSLSPEIALFKKMWQDKLNQIKTGPIKEDYSI